MKADSSSFLKKNYSQHISVQALCWCKPFSNIFRSYKRKLTRKSTFLWENENSRVENIFLTKYSFTRNNAEKLIQRSQKISIDSCVKLLQKRCYHFLQKAGPRKTHLFSKKHHLFLKTQLHVKIQKNKRDSANNFFYVFVFQFYRWRQ